MSGYKKYIPELFDILEKIAPKIDENEPFEDLWEFIEPESIDYGLLEKAKNIFVVSGDFLWNDIGSWNALFEVLNSNKDGNIIKGKGIIMDGKNSLIQSKDKFTAIVGVDDLIVVNTNDATLVTTKDKVEDIKNLVDHLKISGYEDII